MILAAKSPDVCADMREIVELLPPGAYTRIALCQQMNLDCRPWLGLHLRHCGVGRRLVAARALNQQVRYANGVAEKGRSPLQACAAALSPARASPASDLRSSRATGSHDPAPLCRAAALLHLCLPCSSFTGFALCAFTIWGGLILASKKAAQQSSLPSERYLHGLL